MAKRILPAHTKLQIERHSWGTVVQGTREMLIEHGYVTDGSLPGDPGRNKYTLNTTDAQGRAISIARYSKYRFRLYIRYTDEEKEWYDKREAKKQEAERIARMREGNASSGNRGPSSVDIEYLEHFYSLPIDEQTRLLAEKGADPQLIANNILRGKGTVAHETTHLQRLTKAEDSVICNYRLLDERGRRLIANTLASVVASQVSESNSGNVTPLRGLNTPDDDSAGEPTSLQRLIRRESDLMRAYRVMDAETKEAMDYMFSRYLAKDVPCRGNVISIRR